jgi:hypothetical protein
MTIRGRTAAGAPRATPVRACGSDGDDRGDPRAREDRGGVIHLVDGHADGLVPLCRAPDRATSCTTAVGLATCERCLALASGAARSGAETSRTRFSDG